MGFIPVNSYNVYVDYLFKNIPKEIEIYYEFKEKKPFSKRIAIEGWFDQKKKEGIVVFFEVKEDSKTIKVGFYKFEKTKNFSQLNSAKTKYR